MAVCIIYLCVLKTQPIAKSQWKLMILGDAMRLKLHIKHKQKA